MPTIKQKKAVKKLVGNGGNITKAMRESGYSENTLNTPQKLTESVGFKQELENYGLTEELIKASLVEDIEKKPQNRKPELELGAKILRLTSDNPTPNNNFYVTITDDQANSLIARRAASNTTLGKEGSDRLLDADSPEVQAKLAS